MPPGDWHDPGRRRLVTGLLGGLLLPPFTAAGSSRDDGERPPVGHPWPPLESGFLASRDGTPLFCRSGGRGPATVLFIHGWSCNHRFFGPQFAAVAPRYRLMAIDLAGHGRSGQRGKVSVEAFADDVEAAAAESQGPLVLVVHSTGGRVACAAARRLGSRLLGIIGIDTFQNLALPAPDESLIRERLAAQRADFIGDTRRHVATFFQPGANPELVSWVEREMTATEPEAAIAATEAFARFDAAAAIAGWEQPVLALNSDWVPTDYRKIRQLLPGFELVVLAGTGHFPHLDAPDRFNPLLRASLDRLAG